MKIISRVPFFSSHRKKYMISFRYPTKCQFFLISFCCENIRDEKRNLRFPCIQWKRKRNFVPVSTVYKGNANFVFRPWKIYNQYLEVSKHLIKIYFPIIEIENREFFGGEGWEICFKPHDFCPLFCVFFQCSLFTVPFFTVHFSVSILHF